MKGSCSSKKESIVAINDKVYYNEIDIIKNIDSLKICIGNIFSIITYFDRSPTKVNTKSSDYLRTNIEKRAGTKHYRNIRTL